MSNFLKGQPDNKGKETLPNGHKREDYYEKGFSDFEIEFWGLDQPGAPDPNVAGWEIMDGMDGSYDGEIDF